MKDLSVNWAVIPCAGHGTRFLPITKGTPKEMCPIVDKPTVDYIVDEVINAGVKNIVFIVSEGKDDLKRYYSLQKDYENELISTKKEEYAEIIHHIATKANFYFVTQHELLGLGHAVLQAKEIIGNNNFLVCCGDDICLFKEDSPCKQMVNVFKNNGGYSIVGGQKVSHDQINKYGAMDIAEKINDRSYSLKGIIEKPTLEKAPSDLASLGKWLFTPSIFDYLEKTPRGKGNEIQLTDAIELMLKNEKVYFYDFIGTRYDCGDKLGYLKAIVDVALSRDDLNEGFEEFLKNKKF